MEINEALLEACLRDDRRAQGKLYETCYGSLMAVCFRYARDEEDARALLNQGFLKILLNLKKYNVEIPFEAWSRRIVINTIIDEFRKNKRFKETIQLTDTYSSADEYDSYDSNTTEEKMDVEEIELAIQQLPTVTRSVFNLYVVEGYNHKEIAEMLNISDGTSKWHLNNARTRLKDMLGKFYKIANLILAWIIWMK